MLRWLVKQYTVNCTLTDTYKKSIVTMSRVTVKKSEQKKFIKCSLMRHSKDLSIQSTFNQSSWNINCLIHVHIDPLSQQQLLISIWYLLHKCTIMASTVPIAFYLRVIGSSGWVTTWLMSLITCSPNYIP